MFNSDYRFSISVVSAVIFFCFMFLMLFHDGYRRTYSNADELMIAHPNTSYEDAVRQGRARLMNEFHRRVAFMNDRASMGEAGLLTEKRYKLRWALKSLESYFYKAIQTSGLPGALSLAIYMNHVVYALWSTIALLFLYRVTSILSGRQGDELFVGVAAVLFGYLSLSITAPRMSEFHSLIALACLSGVLYFSLKKNLAGVLVVLAFAVANRETGMLMGVAYSLINWRERLFWLPPILAGLFFLALNFDLMLLPEFYNPDHFIISAEVGYVTLFNITKVPLESIAFAFFKMVAILAPLYLIVPRIRIRREAIPLYLLGAMYLIILFFGGAVLGNLLPFSILLPILFALGGLALRSDKATAAK